MKLLIGLTLFIAFILVVKSDNWAVLLAGSNTYSNYRHQADICHSYHILKKNGIPDDHIIVMMYDDIAYNRDNPIQGSIINEPNGPNVYPGTPKDYTGRDVTPANFLKILKGEYMGPNKKTLKSGPNDNVFVYFADHGGPGILGFPDYQLLHASDLIATLKYMYTNQKYKKLVFYMEACESGSMFNKLLPNHWNIYAETASNPYKSSYACYYDRTYRTYLADCYSVNWMDDTEQSDITRRTLEQQFEAIHKKTTQSPTCLYGDRSMGNLVIGQFQGVIGARKTIKKASNNNQFDSVSSRDAKMVYLQRRISLANDNKEQVRFEKELESYQKNATKTDIIFSSFKGLLNLQPQNHVAGSNDADNCYGKGMDVVCMKAAVQSYEKHIGRFGEYSIKYSNYLRDACDAGKTNAEIDNALEKISKVFKN